MSLLLLSFDALACNYPCRSKQQWQRTCCLFHQFSSVMQAELVIAKRHSTTESERQQKMAADLDTRTKELRQAQSNYNKSVRHAPLTHWKSALLCAAGVSLCVSCVCII